VAGFDAESYLRVIAEKWARAGGGTGGPPHDPVFAAAAAALIAVDAMTIANARALIGEYEVRPPLAAGTAWIELLGERVELTARPAGIQTRVEPLPAQDPAVRHLWERVATLNDFHLGHYYLGEQLSWNPGANRSWGTIGFWPALDQRATSVDLMPTAATARAVIRVPLGPHAASQDHETGLVS
jgi:hypothetical protein